MSKPRDYIFDHTRRVKLKRGSEICPAPWCQKRIKIGDHVVSRRGGAGLRIVYHYDCAKELGII